MDINKLEPIKSGSVVFEVTCMHGTNYVVYRKTFDKYRSATKYVRDTLKAAGSKSSHRYEVREVHRLDVMYSCSHNTSRPARRLIETDFVRDWSMNLKPSKKGGKLI